MLTENKKNYAGIINCQEGNILKKPKLDIKGLPIKKVSTNRIVRERFTDILEKNILKADNISLSKIFKRYTKLQKDITKSLKTGSTEFAMPGKVNEPSSYAIPIQQQTVRGSMLWNKLYPDQEIVYPDKVNYMKLNVNLLKDEDNPNEYDMDVIERIVFNDKELSDEEKSYIVQTIKSVVYDNEEFAHYGFGIICFPKDVKKLPSWLVPFIDYNTITEDHLKAGHKIMESTKMSILEYQNNGKPTASLGNIITI